LNSPMGHVIKGAKGWELEGMSLILVCNDDGVESEGLLRLADAMREVGDVLVVAPDREQSASSHSLTMNRPLRIQKLAGNLYSVNGTPTDCVLLAVHALLDGRKPDLLVSGINKGGNLGDDIFYSGTVSAAREGARMGIPSFAVSVAARKDFEFQGACEFSVKMAKWILCNSPLGTVFFNVNVPNLPSRLIKGVRITRQGKRIYNGAVRANRDEKGLLRYWIGGEEPGYLELKDSDIEAVMEGWISLTPLRLDLTDEQAMSILEGLLSEKSPW
jgi:5'-nucleotidase